MNKKPQSIIFDGHGTLTYPTISTLQLYKKYAAVYGKKVSLPFIQKHYYHLRQQHYAFLLRKAYNNQKITWQEDKNQWFLLEKKLFQALGITAHFKALSEAILLAYMQPHNQRPFHDVQPTLKKLQQKHIHLAVLTNSDARYSDILHYYHLDSFFKTICISSEVGYKKPSQKLFYYLTKKLSVQAKQCWYVGDNMAIDIQPALQYGFGKVFWLVRNPRRIVTYHLKHCSLQYQRIPTLTSLLHFL